MTRSFAGELDTWLCVEGEIGACSLLTDENPLAVAPLGFTANELRDGFALLFMLTVACFLMKDMRD